jgi:hypothetical protein
MTIVAEPGEIVVHAHGAVSIGVTRFFRSSRKRAELLDSLRGVLLEQIVVERPA